MRIALASDAWMPQTNGVVRTLSNTVRTLEDLGHDVRMITPVPFDTLPLPTYPEIRIALRSASRIRRILDTANPERVHIATEGPIGWAARTWCLRRGRAFTTSFHTRFPEYLRMRAPVPERWTYRALAWFHRRAARTLVPTRSQQEDLSRRGFRNLRVWGRGVDTRLFRPGRTGRLRGQRPILMYMGRVAVEKNIEAFLNLRVPGTRVVVGDGPALSRLRAQWPDVQFLGARYGDDLAATLADADVFVFPSRTDTFGVVLLEAMACGVPVAAYPVTGPVDVVVDGLTGVLDNDLDTAVRGALRLDPEACRKYALERSWAAATQQFLDALVPALPVDSLGQPGGQFGPETEQRQGQ
jgi:glycosyltransferase involved in cell wall biosynthesis